MKRESVYPVRSLRAQVSSVRAAMTEVMENGKPRLVHKLRTSVRRVEAQLELLSLLGKPSEPALAESPEDAPLKRKEVAVDKRVAALERKVRRRLRRLRRSAGAVRDCDVQLDLVQAHLAGGTHPKLDGEGKKLRRRLEDRRDRKVEELLTLVKREQVKLVPEMEGLLERFGGAESLKLSVAEMTSTLQQWVGDRLRQMDSSDPLVDEDHLHAMRKMAKLARYMAETAPESAGGLRRLGQSYEALQQSGGTWHDWLTLWRVGKHHLGKAAPLTRHFEAEHERSLREYQQVLAMSEING